MGGGYCPREVTGRAAPKRWSPVLLFHVGSTGVSGHRRSWRSSWPSVSEGTERGGSSRARTPTPWTAGAWHDLATLLNCSEVDLGPTGAGTRRSWIPNYDTRRLSEVRRHETFALLETRGRPESRGDVGGAVDAATGQSRGWSGCIGVLTDVSVPGPGRPPAGGGEGHVHRCRRH